MQLLFQKHNLVEGAMKPFVNGLGKGHRATQCVLANF